MRARPGRAPSASVQGLFLVALLLLGACGSELVVDPSGSFAFAVLGDAPYYAWEENQFRRVLRQLDESNLDSVIHVGDILWRPCSDELYRARLSQFEALRHPVIYTPGDNEWTDCHERVAGSYDPLERQVRLRELFFADPTRSLGAAPISLASQGGQEPYPEFLENARWSHHGVVFTTVHIVGAMNGLESFPARTAASDAESKRRTAAATAWLQQSFAAAREQDVLAIVIALHADLDLESPVDTPYRRSFEPFVAVLEEEAVQFARPVLLVHGDNHQFTVDQPLVRRTTGERIDNVTRLEVPGSPEVGWVRVVVTPDRASPFAFEQHLIPRWLVW